ncbi:MAG: 16S rRNA (guanine(527)-N(7))-methyltransferase RsmG [Thermomicrobiales bacterium]
MMGSPDEGQPELLSIGEADDKLGLKLSADQLEALQAYRDLLIEANLRLNLTSITAPRSVDSRLIAESLAIVPLLPDGEQRILDVGTGGGIPGIPLAIALPDARIHLLDSTAKKLAALEEIAERIGLSNLEFIHGRAEDVARDPSRRGCYTIVVARAVAQLATLVEYTLPFLQPGGVAIFPKGERVQDELRDASTAITTLGGRLIDVFVSPVNDARFVRIEQAQLSPRSYPRKPGIPARQPIGVSAR